MSTQSKQNKVTQQARIGQVIAGIQKHFMNQPTIVLGDTSYTPAHLIDTLQSVNKAQAQTAKSRAAWQADVQAERNTLKQVSPLVRYVRSFVVAQFGDTQASSQKLEDFGYAPRKVPVKTAATKAGAAVVGKATRVARGTRGRKQKLTVKGDVTSVSITPVKATPAALQAAAPAAPAASASASSATPK